MMVNMSLMRLRWVNLGSCSIR